MINLLNKVSDNLVNNTKHSPLLSTSAANKSTKGSSINAVDNKLTTNELKNQRGDNVNGSGLARWSGLNKNQLAFSQYKSAENSLSTVYRELGNISTMLNSKVNNVEVMSNRIRQLDHVTSKDLNGQLQPKVLNRHSERPNYVLNSVNLLAKKPAETLSMVLPSAGKSVSFHIPAYAEPKEILMSINRSLAAVDTNVTVNAVQQLVFNPTSDNSRFFNELVLFSGEGIRVPAGNPVPVQMQLQASSLLSIADSIETKTNKQDVNDQVRQVQADVRHAIIQLRASMDQVRNKNSQQGSIDISAVESELSELLSEGDFGSRLTSLLAQANISRNTTVSLLSK
jgi:hypothetical protein